MNNPFSGLRPDQALDIPPLWLLLCCLGAWIQGHHFPVGPAGGPVTDLAGGLLVGAGLLLMLMAVSAMRRANTTVVPHKTADALVTDGIFRRSRNPIYLGDLLILAGLCLRWGAWPALVLVPVLAVILERRFILAEEARLRDAFGAEFERYCARTRRWI